MFTVVLDDLVSTAELIVNLKKKINKSPRLLRENYNPKMNMSMF